MSRAAAENEDLAPRAVSCHLCIEAPHSRANEEFDRVRGGRGRRGWRQDLYSESTILYMVLMRANASSNLVHPNKIFKIDFSMKW